MNAPGAAGQQIKSSRGTRAKARHGRCRCGPSYSGAGGCSHTPEPPSQPVRPDRSYLLRAASAQTRLLKSDQKYLSFFKQTPILSVFTSSEGSSSGPGGTDSERCLWAYLSTLFVIANCGFDPQFNNHDWTCRWFYMFMRGKKGRLTACRCRWRIPFKALIGKITLWTFFQICKWFFSLIFKRLMF